MKYSKKQGNMYRHNDVHDTQQLMLITQTEMHKSDQA